MSASKEPKSCFELKIRCGDDTIRIVEGYASLPLFYVNALDVRLDTAEDFEELKKCLIKIKKQQMRNTKCQS